MSEKFTCPRRIENGMDRDDSPFHMAGSNLDSWDDEDDTCTYCGSLNPDVFMQRLEARDVQLTPTDKSYKAYLDNTRGAPFKQHYRNCPRGDHGQLSECTGPQDCTHWTTRETSRQKFYFQHLSQEQRERFVDLLNRRSIDLAYPGHFYVLPFFCSPFPPAEKMN